jgi:ribose transport system permease protein
MAAEATQVGTTHVSGARGRSFPARNARILVAYAILITLLVVYHQKSPRFTEREARSIANQGMTLSIVGLGQTMVVLTGGIDLSVGPMVSLSNSTAATLGDKENPNEGLALGIAAALLIGAAGGFVNGMLVAYGRLQPIIVTLATGYIYSGIALRVRPDPGGYVPSGTKVPFDYVDFLTGLYRDFFPRSLFLLATLVILWFIFRKLRISTRIFAIGSSQGAAYMSGVDVAKTKVAAYMLCGVSAAIAGLFFTAQTASGDAIAGGVFTLNSIAAVVLGGAALSGGSGSFIGTIAGAYTLAIIPSVLFFFDVSPFYQSFYQGLILLASVSLGALGILRVRNRMERL